MSSNSLSQFLCSNHNAYSPAFLLSRVSQLIVYQVSKLSLHSSFISSPTVLFTSPQVPWAWDSHFFFRTWSFSPVIELTTGALAKFLGEWRCSITLYYCKYEGLMWAESNCWSCVERFLSQILFQHHRDLIHSGRMQNWEKKIINSEKLEHTNI